jgi:hypothetical protein
MYFIIRTNKEIIYKDPLLINNFIRSDLLIMRPNHLYNLTKIFNSNKEKDLQADRIYYIKDIQ